MGLQSWESSGEFSEENGNASDFSVMFLRASNEGIHKPQQSDKSTARLLVMALVEQGEDVWFDEWEIRPGESITGGIEEGVSTCDAFILIWSESAKKIKLGGYGDKSNYQKKS